MNKTVMALHENNLRLMHRYKTIESQLIDSLQEFDRLRGYLELGQRSLFDYCRNLLGMSENQAYSYIRIARKSVDVPALKVAVAQREISVSSAKTIASLLTPENQDEWLEKAKNLPKAELEREIVKTAPKLVKRDRTIPITSEFSECRGLLSDKARKILTRVKELESKRGRQCDLDAAIIAMGSVYLGKMDPLERAKRVSQKTTVAAKTPIRKKVNSTVPMGTVRRKPPARVVHQVNLRDQGRCRVKVGGKACGSRHYTEIHHIRPFSLGGVHSLDNLVTLCSGHHRAVHVGTPLVIAYDDYSVSKISRRYLSSVDITSCVDSRE